jgi:hypothetical protein
MTSRSSGFALQHDTATENRVDVRSPEPSEDERELITTGH